MMLQRSSLTYITALLLFQLLVEVNCQTSFKPKIRSYHTATLIDDKLYILGGVADGSDAGKEFFYLDVSVKFDTTEDLLWQDLTNINIVPSHYSAASVKGGANNNTLILYGGIAPSGMNLVYTFDSQSNSWSTPNLSGYREAYLIGITNYNGKMYLWGGLNELANVNANNMLILDTINISLGIGSLAGAPTPSLNYGAVLLPNNNIIYMGGYSIDKNIELALNQTYIYDTINNQWITQETTGTVPSAKTGFSAVLGLDGQRIIIFGGTTNSTNSSPALKDPLYVLNLSNNFEWSIPKISGEIPNSRMYHKANVIGKYMVISFGRGYDSSIESDILLLDISNNEEYTWTNNFEPSIDSIDSINSTNSKQSKSSNKASIIGMIGALAGGILLFLGIVLLYKWNNNRRKQSELVLEIPENENRDDTPVISIGRTRFSMANSSENLQFYIANNETRTSLANIERERYNKRRSNLNKNTYNL